MSPSLPQVQAEAESARLTIERLDVDRFGHFRDLQLQPGPGLTLFYGPNEAGKSTLLGFVRAMLFGFERRSSESRYEPEDGSHGGGIVLSGPAGKLEVRRAFGKRSDRELMLLDGSGERLPAATLEQSLGGISRELFTEVFAFSLKELGSFERLAAQSGVSEALLTAGLRGARHLRAARDLLRKETDRLFTARGRTPELNQALSRLKEIQGELTRRGDRPAQYFAALHQREEAKARLGQMGLERLRLEREAYQQSRRRDSLPLLREWRALRFEVGARPHLDGFPAGGLERLENLERQRAHALAEQASVDTQRHVLAETRRAQPVLPDLQQAEAAVQEYTAVRAQARALPAARASSEGRRLEVKRALGELGLPCELGALSDRAFPPTRRSVLRSQGDALRDAMNRRRELQGAWDAARSASLDAESEERAAQAKLQTLPELARLEIEDQLLGCQELPAAQAERTAAADALKSAQDALATLTALNPWPSWALWAWEALGLMAMALGLWAVGRGQWGWVPLALGWVALGPALSSRARRAAAVREQERARWTALEGQLQSRLDTARDLLERQSLLAGLPPECPPSMLKDRESKLRRQLEQARARELHVQRVESCVRNLERCQETVERLERSFQESSEVAAQQRAAWQSVLEQEALPTALEPEEALEMWTRWAELRQRTLDLQSEDDRLRVEERGVEQATSMLSKAARALGWPDDGAEALCARIHAAQESVVAGLELRRKQDEQGRMLDAQRARCTTELSLVERELSDLLSRSDCDDSSTFRARAMEAVGHAQALRRTLALAGQIEALMGMGCEALERELSHDGGEEGVSERLRQAEASLAELAQRMEETHQQVGALATQLDQWAKDSDIKLLRSEEELLRSRVEELSSRWAVDQLALVLLDRAQEVFRLEQQPRLLQRASEHFWKLTRGRYGRVWAPGEEGGALRVLDTAKREWSAESLSRGTCEQLYLAFRLAVVEDLCEGRPLLPLMLDDIWVNFDPDRAGAAVELFARMAERHQVMALTCHPWVRQLFEQQGARIIELPSVPGRLRPVGSENWTRPDVSIPG